MTSGGKRKGSGRKLIYGEPTEPVTTKVPKSKKKIFRAEAKKILKKWEVKKPKK
jgi:hypothetical protein